MSNTEAEILEKCEKIYVRVRWTDVLGENREITKAAGDMAEAELLRQELIAECERLIREDMGTEETITTFGDLARVYAREKLKPAKIVGGRKVEGLKSLQDAKRNVARLVARFGKAKLSALRYHHLKAYKMEMLDKGYAISSVHRELETLRALFRMAMLNGWLTINPFYQGEPLINKADENRRTRILSHADEELLLQACNNPDVPHLLPFVICSIDTAARRGELLKLRWKSVFLNDGYMVLLSGTTKTQRSRIVPITPRMKVELEKLAHHTRTSEDALVFGITHSIKKSFATALKKAGITDFVPHDMRHTGITRLVEYGVPEAEAMKISAHTQHATFQRYLNPSPRRISEIGQLIQRNNDQKREQLRQAFPTAAENKAKLIKKAKSEE